MTVPTSTPRPSCRVACTLAAILVTLGGLRLLVAAEPAQGAEAARAAVASALPGVPLAEPADVAVYRATAVEFSATVEHTARRNLCDPLACGFPRVDALGGSALDWSSLERRVSAATRVTFASAEIERLEPLPATWVPGRPCGLACPERLLALAALAAHF
jgi:hypothetical protein